MVGFAFSVQATPTHAAPRRPQSAPVAVYESPEYSTDGKEATEMAKAKKYVFSARTIEEGLRLLNGLRKERNMSGRLARPSRGIWLPREDSNLRPSG